MRVNKKIAYLDKDYLYKLLFILYIYNRSNETLACCSYLKHGIPYQLINFKR